MLKSAVSTAKRTGARLGMIYSIYCPVKNETGGLIRLWKASLASASPYEPIGTRSISIFSSPDAHQCLYCTEHTAGELHLLLNHKPQNLASVLCLIEGLKK